MNTVLTLIATVFRLLRPSRGIHAAPRALRRDLREEARARRVRRYANPLPARPTGPGYASAVPTPSVALRSAPADYLPVIQPEDVNPPADIVRGYYRAYEAHQRASEDRHRLGLAVLMDIAKVPA